MDVVVTYDIETQTQRGVRRLAHVAAICERYGERAQYSVFECRLSDVQLTRLVAELADEIDPRKDSIHIYRLADNIDTACKRIGRLRTHNVGRPWIL